MTLTPKNITAAELIAFTGIASRPALFVRAWNANARKWERVTDRVLVEQSEQAAYSQGIAGLVSGDTAFLGDVNGTRVLVEVR